MENGPPEKNHPFLSLNYLLAYMKKKKKELAKYCSNIPWNKKIILDKLDCVWNNYMSFLNTYIIFKDQKDQFLAKNTQSKLRPGKRVTMCSL